MRRQTTKSSLAPHFHTLVHVLLDPDHAAILHPHCFETEALERVLIHLFQRGGKRDLLHSAGIKAPISNVLNSFRDVNAPEILATIERLCLEPFQSRWEFDALYRTVCEGLSFVNLSTNHFPRAQFLDTLVQLHVPQLSAAPERPRAYLSHTRRENDFFETASGKAPYPNLLKSAWEPDVFQPLAIREHAVLDAFEVIWKVNFCQISTLTKRAVLECFQFTTILKNYLFQVFTAAKCTFLNFLDALRNCDSLYSSLTEAPASDFLQLAPWSEYHSPYAFTAAKSM